MNFAALLPLLVLACIPLYAAEPPNIVFVLADDLGWAELGCYGNRFHETPHLDQLAQEGIRFTQAYAAAPVCSPYRAALLTGQHPARLGILDYLRPNSANGLGRTMITLPKLLRENGYHAGMIGKWHLTGYAHHDAEIELRPQDHGFDFNIASEVKGVGNGANTWPYVFRTQAIRWLDLKENRLGKNEYLTDRLNLEAIEYIERSAKTARPFFLYLSHYAPHSILNGRPDLVKKYIRKHPPGASERANCYLCEDAGLGKGDPGHHWAKSHNPHLAAMLESIDDGIGKIAAKLHALGIAENTLFIFSSDNGGEHKVTSNAPLRGAKSQLYEGGVRVPLIVRWPARIKAGQVHETITQNVDFFPTLRDAAGIEAPGGLLDGESQLPSWVAADPSQTLREVFWHYPLDKPHFLGGISGGAIRSGDWKLIEFFESGERELYNLNQDIGESKNLAEARPELVQELANKLETWRESVEAPRPSAPLISQPRRMLFADHFTAGRLSERLWYGSDFVAVKGRLKRLKNGSETTRIFLREAVFRDAMIRLRFRMGNAKDIRVMTGSDGAYNTVVHLRPDHFYLQTAKDLRIPCYTYRHGECGFRFDPDRWYDLTVELVGDEAVAHIDGEHMVRAKHPIIDQPKTYLALQVDTEAAEFDDWQLFEAKALKPDLLAAARERIDASGKAHPVKRSAEAVLKDRETNAHEWFFQRDKTYRGLVERLDAMDEENRKRFPAVYASHKEVSKGIQAERKRLLAEDPTYKELLHATHRADRAIDDWLIEQQPEIGTLPNTRKKGEINRLRQTLKHEGAYKQRVTEAGKAQAALEAAYPKLFITNDEISAKKKAAAEAAKQDPQFVEARDRRAAIWREKNARLEALDPDLAEFKKARQAEK